MKTQAGLSHIHAESDLVPDPGALDTS